MTQDLRHDGERRIINDHAALRVLLVQVVAARIERAHEVLAAYPVGLLDIAGDGVIHRRRRVAVVRGLLGLELLQELLVLLVILGDLAALHAFLELAAHALDGLPVRLLHGGVGRRARGVPCHVHAPLGKGSVRPVLTECREVPLAEAGIVLQDDLLQLGHWSIRRHRHDRNEFHFVVLRRRKAEVTAQDHEDALPLVADERTKLKQLRGFLQRFGQPLESLIRPLPRIRWESRDLAGIRAHLVDADPNCKAFNSLPFVMH